MTDFDVVQDRSRTAAQKWDKASLNRYFGRDDLLPFWVADMEFRAPQVVTDSLIERAEHGIYGYEVRPPSLIEALQQWYRDRHGWTIDASQVRFSNGVMNAIAALLNLHTEEGDGVIIQPPVFFEFRLVIEANNREIVRNPLIRDESSYRMDYEDLERRAADPRAKVLILCNPHNPVGRVWTRDELQRVGDICRRHGVLVIADEIHGDFTYPGHRYYPYASVVDEQTARMSFSCFSPAKTFNISSVTDSPLVIADPDFREAFDQFTFRLFNDKPAAFSSVAMEAAYRHGGPWLDELLDYLWGNVKFVEQFLEERIPSVKLVEPQGTFLFWLDLRALGLDAKELESFLINDARVAFQSGYKFGRQGAGYARVTAGCARSMLEDGLTRLEGAVRALRR
jgi:cystathionine beta-lyase